MKDSKEIISNGQATGGQNRRSENLTTFANYIYSLDNYTSWYTYECITFLKQIVGPDPDAGVSLLLEALADHDEELRCYAIYALGGFGHLADDAGPALMEALCHPRFKIRRFAILALSRINPNLVNPKIPLSKETLKTSYKYIIDIVNDTSKEISFRAQAFLIINSMYNVYFEDMPITSYPFSSDSADQSWDIVAVGYIQQLKIFYLVGRAYAEGETSVRKASRFLRDAIINNASSDNLPATNVSFLDKIQQIEPLFKRIFGRESFDFLTTPEGLPAKFTAEGKAAWIWTDAFLKRQLSPSWFGFLKIKRDDSEKLIFEFFYER